MRRYWISWSPDLLVQCCSSFYWIPHLLMDPSPSWGAINWAATQELPSISWNPKVQYRVRKSPPLLPILSHINPIHTIPSYLSKIHPDIVHPPTSRSSQWSPSFCVSHPFCVPRIHTLFTLHILANTYLVRVRYWNSVLQYFLQSFGSMRSLH
jgi:hypothetical protein